MGFLGIEIMCDKPHLYPLDYNDYKLSELKKAIDEKCLKITNMNSFTLFAVGDTYLPSFIEHDEEKRAIRIRHTILCLEAAKFLGCGNISIPPGGPLQDLSRDEAISLFYKGLDKIIPLAEALNVKVLIEPEPGLLLENSSQFLSFIKDIRSEWVGLNFDMGHFFCVGEDPCNAFETLLPWIGHVHLEDIAPTRIHNHLIAGQGCLKFAEIFRSMVRSGYRGDISLELYPYVDMPEEAGRQSLEYLLPIFEEAGLKIRHI